MLQFEGDKEFPQPPAELWARLSDARFLVECMPDRESVASAEADRAVCTIRPGLAFIRGKLDVTLSVLEKAEPGSVRLSLASKGIGSTSDVEATLKLTPREGGTALHYSAEVKQLGGLLKAIPKGLIRGAAQKTIADVLANVEARLKA
jgi:carbon monoxide dehydrogenase subunit G